MRPLVNPFVINGCVSSLREYHNKGCDNSRGSSPARCDTALLVSGVVGGLLTATPTDRSRLVMKVGILSISLTRRLTRRSLHLCNATLFFKETIVPETSVRWSEVHG
mmetsp:Transcript_47508/g.70723  ORF Transcript_47508/g.70723 Transcript_47508/m.70723 type:complete len:107 (+) Transcript_47508:600-920(+)